jgi:glutathione S-transferase
MAVREEMTLVSFDLYVQRLALALAEKGAPFRAHRYDLTRKPAWFDALSPLARSRCAKSAKRFFFFESAAILEYIDETPPLPLQPAAPLAKARRRGWLALGASILGEIWVAGDDARPARLRGGGRGAGLRRIPLP